VRDASASPSLTPQCTAKFGAAAAASVVLLEEHLDHAESL